MQKIIPHLWFNDQAEEAAQLYTACFGNSSVGRKTYYGKAGFEIHGQPEGRLMTVEFTLAGLKFVGLNGGPIFTFNPSVSFLVACESEEEVNSIWAKLSEGGAVLMELGEYPFSKRYGWTTDRFGLSWQIMHMGKIPSSQKITPTLMFVGDNAGKAMEAIDLYTSVFRNSSVGNMMRYEEGEEPDKPGTIKHASFTLEGQQFAAMDSARQHNFTFNEAVSFLVSCGTQEEVNYYWEKLSALPESEQCGWLKDRYGVSWQIVPAILDDMLQDPDKEKVERVTNAFLKMQKLNIAELQRAFEGK
jgi:predicted 3-demethylubiquinone-9 3-methyltransferase (glyoxalase superfamily)